MKPTPHAFSPTYIVSTLLALATFAGIESRGLAAEPPDPAYTPNSSQVTGSPNQPGRPSVDALLTEMLTRLQRLETNAQQSPASAGAMPNMGTTAMPIPAGANMSGAGKGGDPVLAGQLAKLRLKMQQLEASMSPPAAGMSGGMAMNGKPGVAAGTPPSGSPPQGGEMPMMMDKMMGMMDKMMGGMGGGAMPAAAPTAGSPPGAGGMSMGGASAPPSGEMAMMAMMMDKMMGMMEKKMGGMGGAMPAAAPMAGSAPGAGAMSMGSAAAPPSGEMAMMPMMMDKMMGMMDKMMSNMGGGAMPTAAPMAGSPPGAGAMSMGGAAAPPNGEMAMMPMMMGKMMGMMDKMMGNMGGGAMPAAAPMAGSAPGAGAMSMGGAAAPPSGEMAMMAMMMDKMMGMMSKEMGGMPAPAPMPGAAPSAGMGMMEDDSMEMAGMMGQMGGAGGPAMATPSALPGFAGASHLYHIGSTGFFLDHPEHIALSIEQRTVLNQIKERAGLDRASTSRSEQEAEQDMWLLTAADQPDHAQIEAKLAMIQKIRGDARMRFIDAVGSAAKVLTDQQRSSLTGYSPPTPAPAQTSAAPPPMAGAMKDM